MMMLSLFALSLLCLRIYFGGFLRILLLLPVFRFITPKLKLIITRLCTAPHLALPITQHQWRLEQRKLGFGSKNSSIINKIYSQEDIVVGKPTERLPKCANLRVVISIRFVVEQQSFHASPFSMSRQRVMKKFRCINIHFGYQLILALQTDPLADYKV